MLEYLLKMSFFFLFFQFGVSTLASMIQRMEELSDVSNDKQLNDWNNFLMTTCDVITSIGTSVSTPIESIPPDVVTKHTGRFDSLTQDKISLLEKLFVDTD